MRCFGLDLAWADHNPSGVAVLDDTGRLIDEQTLTTDAEILAWIASHLEGGTVVAADIPVTVPNETGARPCDRRLASVYGSRRAGPHPANRSIFLERYGRVRGEDLGRQLAELGFSHPWSNSNRVLLEVYPHPGLVEVFDLPERLLYKKGTLAERRRGLRTLRRLLASLQDDEPPLIAPSIRIGTKATGKELKTVEDLLDARFCAWTAAAWQADRVELFGDAETGHIGVPGRAGADTAA